MDEKYNCLFFEGGGCQWEGLVTEIVGHFISVHKASYKPHPINAEINIGTLYQFLTVVFNRIFFVEVKASKSKTIECFVKCVYEYDVAQPPICDFCIQSDYDNFESSHEGMVNGLNHTKNMYMFNFRSNSATSYATTKIRCTITNANNGSNIHLIPMYVHNYSLEKEFENDDSHKQLMVSEYSTTKLSQCKTKTFLEELKCPVCLKYMNAPIFNCSAGHSICQVCKTKLDACPICHTKLTNAQNYALERLILKLQHPCKYAENGCVQILNWENIKQHIDECPYRSIVCPFTICDKQNFSLLTVVEHYKKLHSELLFEDNQLLQISVHTTVGYFSTILDAAHVFILSYEYERYTNSVEFDCVHVNADENEWRKYMFELQFVSKVDGNLKFAVNHYCKTEFTDVGSLIVPVPALKSFIITNPEAQVYFKCLIQKL